MTTTDAQWKQTIGGESSQFDAETLQHLGRALSPLAGRYDSVAATLENGGKAYTDAETLSLIKNYNVAHSAEFKNYDVNIEYLSDSDGFKSANLVDYYKWNLDYRDNKHEEIDPVQGFAAGAGLSAWSTVRSFASVGKDFLSGHQVEAVNNLLDPFVEPRSDMVTTWLTTKSGRDFVFGLQNNSYEKWVQYGKTTADVATLLLPGGVGEVAGIGKVAKVTELTNLAKLSDELVVVGRGIDDVKGVAEAVEVASPAKAPIGTPPWYSSKGPYSVQLSGDSPSGTMTVNGQVAGDVGDFSSGLGANRGVAAIDEAAAASSTGKLSNLSPGDPVMPGPRYKLIQTESGDFKYQMSNGDLRTPNGVFDFVQVDGEIRIAPPKNDSDVSGHLSLSRGADVDYAGTVQFSQKGNLKFWDNNSGHYQPPAAGASVVKLPYDLFKPVHE